MALNAIGVGVLDGAWGDLSAQDREREREPTGEIERTIPDGQIEMFMTRRARLGVKVNLQARASDSIGAYIEGVTPGGPADKAGLQSGDVITRLDGTSLLGGDTKESTERSLPGMRLIELAAKLEPNDTVKVDYRRGKDKRNATIVTQDDPDDVFVFNGPSDARKFTFRGPAGERDFAFGYGGDAHEEMRRNLERMHLDMDQLPRMMFLGELEDLELVGLNPELGSYFGTSEGVLVVRVPKESTIGLKGGDVVQAIDGRKVTSPSQLQRILRTYEGEEAIKFDVMRNKRKDTVSGKMPKRPEGKWKTTPDGGKVKMRTRSTERA
jgi:predicted metalloprotease with PDZ domain